MRVLLLDSYCVKDGIVSWLKEKHTGRTFSIKNNWTHNIYVSSNDTYYDSLNELLDDNRISEKVKSHSFVDRFTNAFAQKTSTVLKIVLNDNFSVQDVAKTIETKKEFGHYWLYNVDTPSVQSYYYEKDLYPLGEYEFDEIAQALIPVDSPEDVEYTIPNLTRLKLNVKPKNKTGRLAKFSDRIDTITVNDKVLKCTDSNESEIILHMAKLINQSDPDIIITEQGDSFDIPYLIHRANANGIPENRLGLSRDKGQNNYSSGITSRGNSYFSYGKTYWKPYMTRLYGRIHIDQSNCFIWENSYSLHGIIEIARVCRIPLHSASRTTIGRCMSSIQFYKAHKRGLLIPWKPTTTEIFKTARNLATGDRGGLILEPETGPHENVAEIDFSSLFPSVMYKRNISGETIECHCCPDSQDKVPELDFRICKKIGIVPESLKLLLDKRKQYKSIQKEHESDDTTNELYEICKARKDALKWILVTSFGYLGFNNAKFGRIDAHMAVCAFARKLLLQAKKIAENEGFHIVHGLVDSLWIYKKNASKNEYECIKNKIETLTGFEMSLDIYKWIVFLPSKEHHTLGVPNKYFGVQDSGKLKMRAIEARRYDIPLFFRRCQKEVIDLLATADNIRQASKLLPECHKIMEKYQTLLKQGSISPEELAFTTRLSKEPGEYTVDTMQRDASYQLLRHGKHLEEGQKIQYIVRDFNSKKKRTIPLDLAGDKVDYDSYRYQKLLRECVDVVLQPFKIQIPVGN